MHCNITDTVYLVIFFFQAEDGIRDLTVTGVQTCALPISDTRTEPRQREHSAGCRNRPQQSARAVEVPCEYLRTRIAQDLRGRWAPRNEEASRMPASQFLENVERDFLRGE